MQTRSTKFVIISTKKFLLNLNEVFLETGELPESDALQLVKRLTRECAPNLSCLKSLIGVIKRTPAVILQVSESILMGTKVPQVIQNINDQATKLRSTFEYRLAIRDLKEKNPDSFQLLLVIAQFPHGASFQDLKFVF